MSTTEVNRFVSPYDDPAPEGAEGWEELYPYYLRFREDRREFEESRFWFADLQHWPTVFKPFDTITVEFAIKCLGQYNTRHLLIPPANGIDYRVHNGYVYMSPVPVPDRPGFLTGTLLILRNLDTDANPAFPQAIQNITSPSTVQSTMGSYLPTVTYMDAAQFEHQGCHGANQ